MNRVAILLTNLLLPVTVTAALAVVGYTHDAPQFTGTGTRTWVPLEVTAREPLPAGCTAEQLRGVIPSEVVVVPAHYYGEQLTVTFDHAHELISNGDEGDDVYVVGFCR